ncbi:MAG: ABC transporter permease [Planctomycetota bacterium]|nr:MAG: ABC transporter permease [Planctomycetota bacterium]
MSLWKIAWRSIQHRALASTLTAFSMALGVALVVAVLVVYQVLDHSFHRSSQGYDLIVGPAKGGSLELVLGTVYYLQPPRGTIPFSVYEELHSGKYSSEAEAAVPVCLGAYYKGFPVVGTTSEMFEVFRYLEDRKYEFAEGGRNFSDDEPFEAVIGARIARETGLGVGDTFRCSHGAPDSTEEHADEFTIVGVIKPTGTPVDRALYINIQGFWLMHEHEDEAAAALQEEIEKAKLQLQQGERSEEDQASPTESGEDHVDHAESAVDLEALSEEVSHEHHEGERRITAVLVRRDWSNAPRAMALPATLAEIPDVQTVEPIQEVERLFDSLLGDIQAILLIFAAMIVIVAGIGLMVSIYNSMSDRKLEIAIMRALGARRATVMAIILFESILLSLGGGLIGAVLGHGLVGILSPVIMEKTGVQVGFFNFQVVELILVPGLIILASAVGYLPAVIAYRTDVADSLKA